jgi:hypothetical protein
MHTTIFAPPLRKLCKIHYSIAYCSKPTESRYAKLLEDQRSTSDCSRRPVVERSIGGRCTVDAQRGRCVKCLSRMPALLLHIVHMVPFVQRSALSSWAPIAYVIIDPAGAFAQRTGGDHSRLFQAGCPVPVVHRYAYLELINGVCPLVSS